ncbi:MAG: ATP-dependent DNA helicase RecG [Planctomycetaceae bacterium]|jgi:ATP-dependent DNA helicase RecG|nr:ATP-dependent DNA helicase RecG [Planctomycetaceae bacterium]
MSAAPPDLRQSVAYLKGVGPQRAEILNRIGLHRAADLLFYFPRDYQDMTEKREIEQLEESGQIQTVVGEIKESSRKSTRRGELLTLVIQCGDKILKGLWFKMSFIQREFGRGRRVMLTGKPKYEAPFWTMMHPQITYLGDNEDENEVEPFLPVYPLTEGLKQFHLRRIMREMLPLYIPLLDEVFPETYLSEHKLLPIAEAVKAIHFPPDKATQLWAKRRFVYQELFVLQLGLAMRRLQHQTHLKSVPLPIDAKIDTRIRQRFPFTLTKAQERVIKEITADMAKPVPMNRLLQGDVGSGKTVVALYAMLLAAAHGHQAVFMAPTEVLARQHLRTLTRMLEGSQVKIAPVFGGQKTAERSLVLQEIATGAAQIVIGTQAIIQNELPFQKLGLVVIDEQHKFGVMQRAALKTGEKFDPHYLVMTATPIPRSVTMTMFGDLDVSIMDGMPPGRQPVKTYIADPDRRTAWWDFVARKVREEHWQGYVVVPMIEDNENVLPLDDDIVSPPDTPLSSLFAVHAALSSGDLKGLRLAMIHGRMSTEEKERIMYDFRTGEIQILIATTVIEVGVDVPNANLLTIENAERFGLSQLHQLRGRIGRGKNPGYCTVFANAATEESQKRLKAFEKLSDGFKLAEKDFEIRGGGDLFGTQQHGIPPLRVADLVRDKEVLYEARQDAGEMVQSDPGLAKPEHAKLRKQMLNRYGKVLNLGDVG